MLPNSLLEYKSHCLFRGHHITGRADIAAGQAAICVRGIIRDDSPRRHLSLLGLEPGEQSEAASPLDLAKGGPLPHREQDLLHVIHHGAAERVQASREHHRRQRRRQERAGT